MAKKEIGLYQIRSGKQRNLPTSLEHGEMAITTDECRVFIGLPSSTTPASLVAGRRKNPNSGSSYVVQGSGEENVEVLTEFTPPHVLDRVFNQATKVTVQANNVTLIQVPYTSRLFFDYVAFPDDLSVLESGSAQVVIIDNGSGNPASYPVLVDQQNNNNDPQGEPNISVDPSSVQLTSAYMTLAIRNDSALNMTFEFVTRGWV